MILLGSNEMACELSSGCENDIYGNLKYCVLHCSHEDIESKDMDDYLKKFSEIFMKYLYESILHDKFYIVGKDKNVTPVYGINEFKYKNIIDNKLLIEKLNTMNIIIRNIVFPESSDLENYMLDARTIMKYLGKVDFESCKFGHLIFNGIKNYYHKYCTFSKDIEILPFPQVKTKDNKESVEYRYIDCIFEGNIILTRSIFTDEIYCNMFYHCFFNKNIIVNNLKFKKTLLKFPDILQVIKNKKLVDTSFDEKEEFDRIKYCYKIKNLSIIDCSFESEFKLNGISEEHCQEIESAGYKFDNDILHMTNLEIVDTKFNSKLEIKNRVIKDFIFKNSNVEKVFDSFESRFEKSYFYKSIFTDFAGFEKVEFGLEGQDVEAYQARFTYTTFMSFSNFRHTKFHSGLDFENSNLKEQPNFLKARISSKNTNRETFRIVKHSFDNVGNKIEANKFYSKEMDAYRREMKGEFKPSERFVFCMNNFISEFGTSYLKPILLLIILFEVYIILLSYYGGAYSLYGTIVQLDMLNNLAKDFLLFSRFLKVGFEFVSLIFYIFSGILIWQIAVAIKRHTQR